MVLLRAALLVVVYFLMTGEDVVPATAPTVDRCRDPGVLVSDAAELRSPGERRYERICGLSMDGTLGWTSSAVVIRDRDTFRLVAKTAEPIALAQEIGDGRIAIITSSGGVFELDRGGLRVSATAERDRFDVLYLHARANGTTLPRTPIDCLHSDAASLLQVEIPLPLHIALSNYHSLQFAPLQVVTVRFHRDDAEIEYERTKGGIVGFSRLTSDDAQRLVRELDQLFAPKPSEASDPTRITLRWTCGGEEHAMRIDSTRARRMRRAIYDRIVEFSPL